MGYVKHLTRRLILAKRKVIRAAVFAPIRQNLGKAAVLVHMIDKQIGKPAGSLQGGLYDKFRGAIAIQIHKVDKIGSVITGISNVGLPFIGVGLHYLRDAARRLGRRWRLAGGQKAAANPA